MVKRKRSASSKNRRPKTGSQDRTTAQRKAFLAACRRLGRDGWLGPLFAAAVEVEEQNPDFLRDIVLDFLNGAGCQIGDPISWWCLTQEAVARDAPDSEVLYSARRWM